MNKIPEILNTVEVAKSRLFRVEQVELRFANGEIRTYERLRGQRPRNSVMIVPLLDDNTVLLVREYAVGLERYELGLPKGLLEGDEDILQAANRELMEETGYGARELRHLRGLSAMPGYQSGMMQVIVAQDLYAARLEGDEPEPIEVVPWRLDNLAELAMREDFSEARSIAALFMVKEGL